MERLKERMEKEKVKRSEAESKILNQAIEELTTINKGKAAPKVNIKLDSAIAELKLAPLVPIVDSDDVATDEEEDMI